MDREEGQVRDLFARVDEVIDVAHAIEEDRPTEAARLLSVSRSALSDAAPVRVPIAARILLVSDKTVRAWAAEGLLKPSVARPRLLLDPERLHAVLQFLNELRESGRDRDFRDDLWHRLQDAALLDRTDISESLEQLSAGDLMPARTAQEERRKRR